MSALKAGMSRNTARQYLRQSEVMEPRQVPHTWRTRPDPLEAVWEQALAMLRGAPELEAKALFEHLAQGRGEALKPGLVRTFQRRVRPWRLTEGPEKEVFFTQDHAPGAVLAYSNWEWAVRANRESTLSLRRAHPRRHRLFAAEPGGTERSEIDSRRQPEGWRRSRNQMEVRFTLPAERYERRSILISSHLVFSRWDQIFKDPMTTMAAIDRLGHHSIILEFDGASQRALKAGEKAGETAQKPAAE